MRAAIISDIHGNLPALNAVLADIEDRSPDAVWCLGDIVGYGADPNDCVSLTRDRADACLAGNHDLGVLGTIDIGSFSPAAAEAARWTRDALSDAAREFLASLEAADETHEAALYHASPRDHVWEYVLWPEQAGECMAAQATRVAMVGHSHVALAFRAPAENNPEDGDGTQGAQIAGGTTLDVSEDRWLLNPGSVGPPPAGAPRAPGRERDTQRGHAPYHRGAYDIDRAAEAIVQAGLPEHLGRRLYLGQ